MTTFSISKLARMFGLSRSTLLYYDRIGLLHSVKRTASGYRLYTEEDRHRLERICMFRNAGIPLSDVKRLMPGNLAPSVEILEKRLKELDEEILSLRSQQHSIVGLLKSMKEGAYGPVVDKAMWVAMMESSGMDQAAMIRWHYEFEKRAPEAHHEFLMSLGIPENEAAQIREMSITVNRETE